jgi:hypothetical protein
VKQGNGPGGPTPAGHGARTGRKRAGRSRIGIVRSRTRGSQTRQWLHPVTTGESPASIYDGVHYSTRDCAPPVDPGQALSSGTDSLVQ